MDMDELFSQVDEKRKVSMNIMHHSFLLSLSSNCQYLAVPGARGGKFTKVTKALGSCMSLPTLSLSARLSSWQQESEEAAALATSCLRWSASY